jgi:AcrR family transcriptional regulator
MIQAGPSSWDRRDDVKGNRDSNRLQAIAELLSDRDVFWIAQEFLHIPAEIMPALADRDGSYARQVERWADRSPMVVSNADFAEVKFGLRRATFHNDGRPHLLFWIGLMEHFLKDSAPRQLQRSADYELAVAHLRGKGDLTGEFGLVRDYFADVEDWLAVADLQDATTLLVYTPAALYFHFESKEAIYAEVLKASLASLGTAVDQAVAQTRTPALKLKAAAMSFFRFYAENPQDLDLGFYLFRGGMKPAGLGHERDERLNAALEAALHPIAEAAIELGAPRQKANLLMVDCFAHATGLLLLLHTGRIRMFGASAPDLMQAYVKDRIPHLAEV